MAKVTSHFDELAEDTRLANAEQRFRITVFNCLIDAETSELAHRHGSQQ